MESEWKYEYLEWLKNRPDLKDTKELETAWHTAWELGRACLLRDDQE